MIRVLPACFWLFALPPFVAFSQENQATPTPQNATEKKPTPVDQASESAQGTTPSDSNDPMRELQSRGVQEQHASWGHWGIQPNRYSTWKKHSNRLIPVYTFGITLDSLKEEGSIYTDPQRLEKLYGRVPAGTANPTATYFDQTDIYRLQKMAADAGRRNIILMVFDGMDWQTTRAAAIYHAASHQKSTPVYSKGRGKGLAFQDERRTTTDFGLICTSPLLTKAKLDVNSQTMNAGSIDSTGGYDATRGGTAPWHEQSQRDYLIGRDREQPHSVTDSAASATSMTSGIKTVNGAINVDTHGNHVIPIARQLQSEKDFKIGVVTSVPVSHATPAAAYANNVSRKDYQDISRDLLGLRSSSHRNTPLSGVDVLIGGGWGEGSEQDKLQGDNFMSGNQYLHQDDVQRVNQKNGGNYVVAQRTPGVSGGKHLLAAATRAAKEDARLLGFFGTKRGHLPFQTANGDFNPTFDARGTERYQPADVTENPSLAEMTQAALTVLEGSAAGFWLMVEAGDVDWANHANNIDNSIGAVLSGDDAFKVVMDWIDKNQAWSETAVIVTADHGHYLVIKDADQIAAAGTAAAQVDP